MKSGQEKQLIMITAICVMVTVVYITVRLLTNDGNSNKEFFSNNSTEIDSLVARLDTIVFSKYKRREPLRLSTSQFAERKQFVFNPNSADSVELLQLGFNPYMVKNMLRYRTSGGTIRNSKKFKEIYGIDTALINSLDGYINYPTAVIRSDDAIQAAKYIPKEYFAFELNSADTLLLKQLPGIGIGRAKQIVSHRWRLGGYNSAEQLLEIENMPDSVVKNLKPFISIVKDSIRPILINKSSIRTLKRHPYINYYQAKAIYEMRWDKAHKGTITLKDLEEIAEFTAEELKRLLPYLSF